MPERWKVIEEYPDYEVSTEGNIKSNRRKITPIIMKPQINNRGYLRVRLINDFKRKNMLIHVLVAQAFVKNPHNLPKVNHINNNCLDCYYKNLKWTTDSENIQWAFKSGRMEHQKQCTRERCGEKHPTSKLTQKQALDIKFNPNKLKNVELARKYNIHPVHVSHIRHGQRWKHLNINPVAPN